MNAFASQLIPSTAKKVEKHIGTSEETIAIILENWIRATKTPTHIVVVEKQSTAEKTAEDIRFFQSRIRKDPDTTIIVLPEASNDPDNPAESFDSGSDRLAVFTLLSTPLSGKSQRVIVTTPAALAQPAPSPETLAQSSIELKTGSMVDFGKLVERLHSLDYDCEGLCEAPGQFARRGGIIDVYPVTADKPYRIDFFGDEIESIRELDPITQRSGDKTDVLSISTTPRVEIQGEPGAIAHYLNSDVAWGLIEPDNLLDDISTRSSDDLNLGQVWLAITGSRQTRNDLWATFSDLDLGGESDGKEFVYEAESLVHYRPMADSTKFADERLADEQAARIQFLQQLKQWEAEGQKIVFILPNESDEHRIAELLRDSKDLKSLKPIYWTGNLNQGFRIRFRDNLSRLEWPLLKKTTGIVAVTETEIFGRRRNRKPLGRKKALVTQSQIDQLLDFAELVDGEFVVHLQHGIAVYRGITKVDIRGQTREVLTLEFDDAMLLHVPLQESHLISRYVGLTKTRPRLGKLGSNRWAKTREAAERATIDLAAQLLQIQAARDLEKGHAFPSDNQWQIEFESSFPFTETPDQMQAIVDTKKDMEQVKPMDRLICGDVGFGKTEIAIRAAFKAVNGGKQVAILVPTTVLAQQHFLNFRDRMASFPIVVELVSRFRKPRDIKKILEATKQGKVDILIGTHRLISKDVSFKELGLVVVDEEQRFGVKHKEVFKQWKETVDVLTLSATPIPRTLYMALTGARELSVIETAPRERKPIQTIVKSYDEKLVESVIRREIDRGGQVFYLHNRVQSIDTVAAKLRTMMPDVSFGVGHGQMVEKDLERIMLDFMDGKFQVLVCTTIIESGLDIPNCNTIIIEGADRFGLGQLYQIRGRVGRFKRQAYAYLLLHKHKRLMDVARKRLQAIRHHNQLGAGFRIAMRDLELRGAGNLLGPEQSGHIVGVGFELYCQLLKQSISRLKGEDSALAIRANVKLDFIYQGEGRAEEAARAQDGYQVLKSIEIESDDCPPMQARIPASFLEETRLRIDLYRKLAMAETPERIRELREDIVDRFGPYPPELEALIKLAEIRCLAEQKRIVSVESQGNRLKCRVGKGKTNELIKFGSRFPRLRSNNALKRLDEVIVFLRNYVAR